MCISQSRQRPQKKPGLATSQTSQPLSGVSNINGQQFSEKLDEQHPRFVSRKAISKWHKIIYHKKCPMKIQWCFANRRGARNRKFAASLKWVKLILAPRNGISTIAIRGQL
jgi:hypothetical protein